MYPQTLSRPYAKAAFAIAAENQSEQAWSDFLQQAAQLLTIKSMSDFLSDPRIPSEEKMNVFTTSFDKSGGKWGDEKSKSLQQQFLKTLAEESGRLTLLPHIAEHYAQSWSHAKGEFTTHIESAYAISPEMLKDLVTRLEGVFAKKLTATTEENPDLIGGFRATVGDRVLDCSIKTSLEKAAIALNR